MPHFERDKFTFDGRLKADEQKQVNLLSFVLRTATFVPTNVA